MTARAARSSSLEVDLVGVRDEAPRRRARRCGRRRGARRRSSRYARAGSVANGRTRALAAEAVEVRLHGAERREHLLVVDRQPGGAQLPRERGRRHVAAVREERERPARRGDPVEHLARAGDDVHLVGPARWTSVPSMSKTNAADVVKTHGATPPGRRPCWTRRYEIDRRRSTSRRRRTSGSPPVIGARSRPLGDRRRGAHRVDLLLRHRQPQQQLLVGDAIAEARARAVEADRLRVAQRRRPSGASSTRSATSGSGGAANSP